MHTPLPSSCLSRFAVEEEVVPKSCTHVLYEEDTRPIGIDGHAAIVFVAMPIWEVRRRPAAILVKRARSRDVRPHGRGRQRGNFLNGFLASALCRLRSMGETCSCAGRMNPQRTFLMEWLGDASTMRDAQKFHDYTEAVTQEVRSKFGTWNLSVVVFTCSLSQVRVA